MKISNFKLQIISIIFIISCLSSSPLTANVSAQDSTPSPSVSPKSINYQLAYPGLLPDHPLHFLKAARDRVISFFISKPIKKAEFNLLQADKRVEASKMLLQKGKLDLSQSTFSKAENYFEDAINSTTDAKTQGMNTLEIAGKMTEANLKHKQVLKDMIKKMKPADAKKFSREADRLLEFEKKVKYLAPKQ